MVGILRQNYRGTTIREAQLWISATFSPVRLVLKDSSKLSFMLFVLFLAIGECNLIQSNLICAYSPSCESNGLPNSLLNSQKVYETIHTYFTILACAYHVRVKSSQQYGLRNQIF